MLETAVQRCGELGSMSSSVFAAFATEAELESSWIECTLTMFDPTDRAVNRVCAQTHAVQLGARGSLAGSSVVSGLLEAYTQLCGVGLEAPTAMQYQQACTGSQLLLLLLLAVSAATGAAAAPRPGQCTQLVQQYMSEHTSDFKAKQDVNKFTFFLHVPRTGGCGGTPRRFPSSPVLPSWDLGA